MVGSHKTLMLKHLDIFLCHEFFEEYKKFFEEYKNNLLLLIWYFMQLTEEYENIDLIANLLAYLEM